MESLLNPAWLTRSGRETSGMLLSGVRGPGLDSRLSEVAQDPASAGVIDMSVGRSCVVGRVSR